MIYVDDGYTRFGRMKCCHMMADTDEELERVAKRLGLRPEWRHGDHYDLGKGKRKAALRLGAVPVTAQDLILLRRARRRAKIFAAEYGPSPLLPALKIFADFHSFSAAAKIDFFRALAPLREITPVPSH